MKELTGLGFNSTEIVDAALMERAALVTCTACGVQEYVLPIEGDDPLEADFIANYLCADCDE